MPILHVRALPQKDPSKIQPALKATCEAIAQAGGYELHQVWASWEEIRSGHYVEGATSAEIQPQETHPPLCNLTAFEGCSPRKIEAMLSAAAEALTEGLGIPGNVFMTFTEAKSGRVIAGNGIVRKS